MKTWYEGNFTARPPPAGSSVDPLLPFIQAEVWDLEVLRSNSSSWPINVADVKEGLITVKGHTQVGGGREEAAALAESRCTHAHAEAGETGSGRERPAAVAKGRRVSHVLHASDRNRRLGAFARPCPGRGFGYCVTTESCPPSQRVSEGALSPDGTVLATASHDGHIKFWQMYIEAGQDKPR